MENGDTTFIMRTRICPSSYAHGLQPCVHQGFALMTWPHG